MEEKFDNMLLINEIFGKDNKYIHLEQFTNM